MGGGMRRLDYSLLLAPSSLASLPLRLRRVERRADQSANGKQNQRVRWLVLFHTFQLSLGHFKCSLLGLHHYLHLLDATLGFRFGAERFQSCSLRHAVFGLN